MLPAKLWEPWQNFAWELDVTANFLVNHSLSSQHYFRNAVYQYLIAKNKIDVYYWYGLNGMQALIEHNREITHAGSDYWFVQFLLRIESTNHLKQLIWHFSDSKWVAYFDRHSIAGKKFFIEVCKIAELLYPKDSSVNSAMAQFFKKLEAHQNESLLRNSCWVF